jgi:hypothetical protein
MLKACIISVAALLIVACSCVNRIGDDYCYVSTNGIKIRDTIHLSLKIDTGYISTLYLCVKINNSFLKNRDNTLPLILIFTSPDKKLYSDTVKLPLNIRLNKRNSRISNGCINIEYPYLTNINNKIPGLWHIDIIRYRFNINHPLVQGLGMSAKRKE